MFSRSNFRSAARFSTSRTALFNRAAIARISTAQARSSSATQHITDNDEHSILDAQRKHRPVAPHLSIYQPQLTWYGSAMNRITGIILSGGIYTYFGAYAIAPVMGWHLDTASLAAAFGSLPVAAKVGIKGLVAFPFSYHSWNGIRHLIWDTGRLLDIKDVYRSGYVVITLTTISTIYLALI